MRDLIPVFSIMFTNETEERTSNVNNFEGRSRDLFSTFDRKVLVPRTQIYFHNSFSSIFRFSNLSLKIEKV